MAASSPVTAGPASALLQEAPLRELIAANVVAGVTAKGGNGGFVLEIRFGDRRALLASARGSARIFASLATIAVLLQRLGYGHERRWAWPCLQFQ
jgi:nitrate/nitrite transporter NarK